MSESLVANDYDGWFRWIGKQDNAKNSEVESIGFNQNFPFVFTLPCNGKTQIP